MAKRRGRPKGSKNRTTAGIPETIGTALGNVAARLDSWMAQREVITKDLQDVIARAQGMLSSMGGAVRENAVRIGLPLKAQYTAVASLQAAGATVAKAAKRKRRKMSAAEKKAVSARMKKYWAARKAGK